MSLGAFGRRGLRPGGRTFFRVMHLLVVVLFAAHAATAAAAADLLSLGRHFFAGADRTGELGGKPPAAPVYRADELLGYVLLTDRVVPIPAYSGKPISTAVGINLDGIITGTRIVHHEEPILVVGVTAQHLARYTAQYVGKSVNDRVKIGGEPRAGYETVDGISGATITVMVINRTIMAAARKVAETRGIPRASRQAVTGSAAAGPEPRFDPVLDPIWGYAWRQKQIQTVVLVVALVLLSLILVFQDWLARYPRLLLTVRDGYLIFTLLFIGWYGLAQLSVVNVLTFVHAAMHGFSWDVFLVDPMMFLLWGFVAVTVVLWGRGVYCGWLCPFGAVQELVHQIGQRLGVRSLELPQMLHERLWAIKYVIFIALFGLSLESLGGAARFLEVEPFKTAITLRFHREWPFVLYAGGLVAASVFNRKFYCRYLCPLGAALTFPGALPDLRLAAPAQGMRASLSDLCRGVRGSGHQPHGRD